jgi:hypothetical protein
MWTEGARGLFRGYAAGSAATRELECAWQCRQPTGGNAAVVTRTGGNPVSVTPRARAAAWGRAGTGFRPGVLRHLGLGGSPRMTTSGIAPRRGLPSHAGEPKPHGHGPPIRSTTGSPVLLHTTLVRRPVPHRPAARRRVAEHRHVLGRAGGPAPSRGASMKERTHGDAQGHLLLVPLRVAEWAVLV